MAIPYAPSTSSILWPGASVTIAFFQSARRPSERPIRFSFPSNEAVRTEATLTLNTVSTATRISTLLASGRTRNATVFCSSFWRMLFSVMSGRIRISRAARVIGAGSVRAAWTAGGLRGARAGSDTPGLPSQRSGVGLLVGASAERLFREGLLHGHEAGPLLLPRLPAAAGHLAPPRGVVRAGPTVGELSRHRLVEQWHADLDTEYVRFQLERAGLLALRVQHLYGRHRYFFSAIFCACCAFVAFTDFRSITRDPFAPGTAPRINTRFCSSITRTTERFSTVRRAPPMRPGIWWPGHTREGSDDAPIDPGAR